MQDLIINTFIYVIQFLAKDQHLSVFLKVMTASTAFVGIFECIEYVFFQ